MGARSHRPAAIWAVLVSLTFASVAVAEFTASHLVLVAVVFGVAIIKGLLVARHFMEVDRARPVWKTLYCTWIAAIGMVLIVGHALA